MSTHCDISQCITSITIPGGQPVALNHSSSCVAASYNGHSSPAGHWEVLLAVVA